MVTNISIKYIIYRNSEKIYSYFLKREANIDFASKNSKVIRADDRKNANTFKK